MIQRVNSGARLGGFLMVAMLMAVDAGASTIAQNSSWTVTRPGATETVRVVAYGDSIFAGYISIFSQTRRAAPFVAGEYCAAALGQNVNIVRRCQSGAVASGVYARINSTTDRAFMADPSTRIVTFEMCGNDYLQARSSFKSSSGTCNYSGLTTAGANCQTYTQLAMDSINTHAHANTKQKIVANLYYPGFNADNSFSNCTDPVNGDPANGNRVNMQKLFLPLLIESNWWTCKYAADKGFLCADAFANYMARDYDSNDDGIIDSDAIRYIEGESLEDYRQRLLDLSSTLRDANFKLVNSTTSFDYILSDDTHPTSEGPTSGSSGTVTVFHPTAGAYPDSKNPHWNWNGHDRLGWGLNPSCALSNVTCGDGTMGTEWLPSGEAQTEACDDGNTDDGDGCSDTCAVEEGYFCSGAPSMCAPVCGDGFLAGGEQCDDGNSDAGDGCSSTCTVEPGFSCMGGPSTCQYICGDGLIVTGEVCDDSNLDNNDGCSSDCGVETGWNCSGEPSSCAPICGDGLTVGTEECDDADGNGTALSCCSECCAFQPAGTACDDEQLCTISDSCDGANACVGEPDPCDDGNECTDGTCDPETGCAYTSNTAPCDDGDVCTAPDTCSASMCVPGVPVYGFEGFLPPLDNLPILNVGKAGRNYPIKWKLPLCAGGYVNRLDAVVHNPLRVRQVACDTNAPEELMPTDTPGASGLTYDAGSNTYHYNWKTSSTFANKCYELLLELDDGTTQIAGFKFTK